MTYFAEKDDTRSGEGLASGGLFNQSFGKADRSVFVNDLVKPLDLQRLQLFGWTRDMVAEILSGVSTQDLKRVSSALNALASMPLFIPFLNPERSHDVESVTRCRQQIVREIERRKARPSVPKLRECSFPEGLRASVQEEEKGDTTIEPESLLNCRLKSLLNCFAFKGFSRAQVNLSGYSSLVLHDALIGLRRRFSLDGEEFKEAVTQYVLNNSIDLLRAGDVIEEELNRRADVAPLQRGSEEAERRASFLAQNTCYGNDLTPHNPSQVNHPPRAGSFVPAYTPSRGPTIGTDEWLKEKREARAREASERHFRETGNHSGSTG